MNYPNLFDAMNASQESCSLRAWLGNETTVPHYPEDALDMMLVRAYENNADIAGLLADLRYCRDQLESAIKAVIRFDESVTRDEEGGA